MRLKEFLDLYVNSETYIHVECIQEPYSFEGTCSELMSIIATEENSLGGLWLDSVYAQDDTLMIAVSF